MFFHFRSLLSLSQVIQSKDGSGYEILAPSKEEYDQLVKEGGVGIVDISKAPMHLKCPLSGSLLIDAVQLPCCYKVPSSPLHHTLVLPICPST